MTRLIAIILFCTGIFCLAAESPVGQSHAQVPMTGAGLGAPSGGGGAFAGIGDVYTGTVVHYGNRAASAARKGNKLWNVCDSATGLTCVDWSSDATTGLIVTSNVAGSACTGVRCEVATAYDDSGANKCSVVGVPGNPCDLIATHGSRPTVTLSAVNGLPVIVCAGNFLKSSTNLITANISQPFTQSVVAERTGSSTTAMTAFSGDAVGLLGFNSVATQMFGYAGTQFNTATGLTESVFHALQFAANNTSSVIQGDGVAPATGAGGTSAIAVGDTFVICSDSFSEPLTGGFAEAWTGTGDQHTTFNAAHSNQSAAYGTP